MLETRDLHTHYGTSHILKGVNIHVRQGEIVALIGANGAGKTTLLKTISGIITPSRGEILFLGSRIHGAPTHRIAQSGISHVPEGRRIFSRLTVLENLYMGAYHRPDTSGIQNDIHEMFRQFPILKDRSAQTAGTLSGGEQQMLAIARALMSRPKLLLLDEPSLGLAPKIFGKIFDIIQGINKQGVTILLIEQNAHMAMEIAQRAYVLETGQITLEGTGSELRGHPVVKEAYLGG